MPGMESKVLDIQSQGYVTHKGEKSKTVETDTKKIDTDDRVALSKESYSKEKEVR